MNRRYPHTVAGVMTREKKENGSVEIALWNATTFATDDEMARMLTLGAMLERFPMKDGWKNHTVFVTRIEAETLALWREEELRS